MDVLPDAVKGLNLVLGGGLSAGSLVVVAGSPGTGKTILAQQLCFLNATLEHPAIYYTTLSEPHTKLVRHLEPFSFFDPAALERRVEFVHLGGLLGDQPGQGLVAGADEITRHIFEADPSVVVIDSSKALHGFADENTFRRVLYELASKVAHNSTVLMLVGEYTPDEMETLPEFAVADAIIELAREPEGPVDRPWLRVHKARGKAPLTGQHSFAIGPDGVEVFPRLETTLPVRSVSSTERISTGIPGLDAKLGGGLPRGDATLVLGPSGAGKTILALQFIVDGLASGESCVFLSFQENQEQLARKAASFGWDLNGPVGSGQLRVLYVPPVEVDLDIVGTLLREATAKTAVGRVAIDSLAELAYAARQTERLPGYVWAVAGLMSAQGASTLVTSEAGAALGPLQEVAGGLSFLFQNMVLLRFVETASRMERILTVLKMRDSAHDRSHIRFEIADQGLAMLGVLESPRGAIDVTKLATDPGGGGII